MMTARKISTWRQNKEIPAPTLDVTQRNYMLTTSNTVVDHEGCTSHTRSDILTAQKIDVGIIFQAMLGTIIAAEYLMRSGVPLEIALRVLTISHRKTPTPPLLIGDPKLPHVTTNAQKLGDIANVDALTVLKS